jgi:hypothetical protein
MANPIRGEVALEAEGQGYTLRLGINALVEIETALDIGIADVTTLFSGAGLKVGNVRLVLWAALREHQPSMTLEQAGDIMNAVGLADTIAKLGEALQAAFPEAKGDKKPSRPPKPVGTGKAS